MWRCSLVLVASLAAGCAAMAPRRATSSLGCMRAEVRELPASLSDDEKHCVGSGLIARHCSLTESWLAGAGKEVKDLFTAGDASWADWRADRRGMQCGRNAANDEAVMACCREQMGE